MFKFILVPLMFVGTALGAYALDSSEVCAINEGAPVQKFLAFVIDWQDTPGIEQQPTLVAQAPDPVAVSDPLLAVTAARTVPFPVANRPRIIAPSVTQASATVPAPRIQIPRQIPLEQARNAIDFSGVWLIGSFR